MTTENSYSRIFFMFLCYPFPAVSPFKKTALSKVKGPKTPLISSTVPAKGDPSYIPRNTPGRAQVPQSQKSTSELLLLQYFSCDISYNLLACKERIDSHLTLPAVNLLTAFSYELKSGLHRCIIRALHNNS